jgi:flagellar motor switch/type III secretory pathway protein FliN
MDRSEVLESFAELPFTVEAELGNLSLTIGEILTLQEGTILRTDHPAGTPFKMCVGGAEIASAGALAVGDLLAMRVESLRKIAGSSAETNGTN